MSLYFLFALGSFAIIASVVRAVLYINSATIATIITWSIVEQFVSFLVVNAPALRPLFFRGNNFESSTKTPTLRSTGRSVHDAYELAPNGVVSRVSAGDPTVPKSRDSTIHIPSNNADGILRTIEIIRTSEDLQEKHHAEGRRGSRASYWGQ